jgi:hypothetical protein
MAKMVPLSRTPRRLIHVISAIASSARGTRWSLSSGKADVMARTPAETDTETVRT